MEKNQFTNLMDKISTVATLDKWPNVFYDTQLDSLVWKKNELSKDCKMVKVSHEVYFYINSKKQIEGVMVEYFKNNFTKHNAEFKDIVKILDKRNDDKKYTISRKNEKNENFFSRLINGLKCDIYKDAIEDKNTINDLNFVLASAMAA
jgi:hypothetical protein